MEAVKVIVEDAPEEIVILIPKEWRNRRVEVVVTALEGSESVPSQAETRPYHTQEARHRVILERDALHERRTIPDGVSNEAHESGENA